jgi:hypothetical protein
VIILSKLFSYANIAKYHPRRHIGKKTKTDKKNTQGKLRDKTPFYVTQAPPALPDHRCFHA